MNSTTHDLTGAYLLGALEPGELEAFEAHLEACAQCRTEVSSLSAVIEELGTDAAQEAPSSLQAAVMSEIASTPQEQAPGAVVSDMAAARERRLGAGSGPARWLAVAAAAVGVIAISVTGLLNLGGETTPAEQVLAASDAHGVDLGLGDSEVVVSGEAGGYAVHGSAPALADGREYQLWFVAADGAVAPGPTFTPGNDGTFEHGELRDLDGVIAFAVTVEPVGGSAEPTSEPIAIAEL